MPVRLWWGGREVRSSWGMDVFLRAGGARARASARGSSRPGATTWRWRSGLGLTPSSYGLFKKLRYHDVGPVPFFQKVLDPRRGRAAAASGRAGAAAGAPLLRPGPGGSSSRSSARPADGVEVRRRRRASPREYDALWERARASYAMCVRRDAAYLDWKYARCPHRRVRRCARRGGTGVLAGFAVSRHEDYRGPAAGLDRGRVRRRRATTTAQGRAHRARCSTASARAGVARAQAFAMNARPGRRPAPPRVPRGPLAHAVLRARPRRSRTTSLDRPRRAGTSSSATATWTDERDARPAVLVGIDTEADDQWSATRARRDWRCATPSGCPRCRRCSTSSACGRRTWSPTRWPRGRRARRSCAGWPRTGRCEIGTHLHPWSSPPFRPEDLAAPHLSAQPAAGAAGPPAHAS